MLVNIERDNGSLQAVIYCPQALIKSEFLLHIFELHVNIIQLSPLLATDNGGALLWITLAAIKDAFI